MAQEELEQRTKQVKEIFYNQEKRIERLQIKAIQYVNLYFMFQGVILAACFNTSIKCELWRIPFTLSLLVSIFNNTAFYFTILEILEISDLRDETLGHYHLLKGKLKPKFPEEDEETQEINETQECRWHNYIAWPFLKLFKICDLIERGIRRQFREYKSTLWRIFYYLWLALMLYFTVEMLKAYKVLLCHPRNPNNH